MMLANWLNLYANVSFQFALLGSFVWLITRFRPFQSAPIQYMLWTICLLSLLILPFLNLLLPAFSVPRIVTESNDVQSKVSALTTTVAEVKDDSMPSLPISKNRTIESARPFPWYQIVFGVWLAGSVWCMVRLFAGLYQLRRLRKRSLLVTDTAILQQLDRLCQQAQVSSQVTLLADLTMPFSFGWRKFYIVLPKTLLQTSAEKQRELVLLHELAHLKRRDGRIKFIENLLGVFMWFHPVYHLSCVSLHRYREQICDDWVLRWSSRVSDYAQCLTDLTISTRNYDRIAYSLSLMQDRSWLQRRVFYLLDRTQPRRVRLSKLERIGAIGLFVVLIPFLAVTQLVPVVNVWAQFSQQAQSADLPWIAFGYHLLAGQNGEIYVIRANGTGQENITNHPAFDGDPAWSPDGKWIAFSSNRDGNSNIYLIDPKGGNLKRLTDHDDISPSWSPDGKWIAFTRREGGNNADIYVMDISGQNLKNLTRHPAWDVSPAWSPDGKQIAFESNRQGNLDIYIMDIASGKVQAISPDPTEDRSPSWSPDGKKLAFQSSRAGNADIFLFDLETGELKNLTPDLFISGQPAFAPDGKQIAFTSNRAAKDAPGKGLFHAIYVVDIDGKNLRRVTENPGSWDRDPTWFDPSIPFSVNWLDKWISTWGRVKSKFKP